MPVPLSRNESANAGDEAGGRQGEARDPAAELRARTRRRLIGASLLLLAAIIVLPMLLDTRPRPVPENIAITVATPPLAPVAPAPAEKPPAVDEKVTEPAPVPARTEAEPVEPPAKAAPPAEPKPSPQATAPERPEAPPAPTSTRSKFVVQVAALASAGAADELVARLSLGGFSAYAESVGTASGTLHRVRVGPYASRDDAQRAIDRLKAAGHKATLVGG